MGDLFAPSHILLVLIFALLFFGPRKLPELGRAFGKTIKSFRDGTKEVMEDVEKQAPPTSASTGNEVRRLE